MDQQQRRSETIRSGRFLSVSEFDDSTYDDARSQQSISDAIDEHLSDLSSSLKSSKTESRESTDSFDRRNLRASALPGPLDWKREQQPVVRAAPPTRLYGGAPGKIKERLGVEEVEVDFGHIEPKPPRRPPPALRALSNRLSLTPSERQSPIDLLRGQDAQYSAKIERTLGLRRASKPPPVPPKDPKRGSTVSTSTTDSLPLHKEIVPKDALEPRNGHTAWMHSLTGMLVVFNCWGLSNAYGLFQAYYETKYLRGTSPSAIAWIGSTQLALVFGLGVPVGRLVDRGYFRHVFHGGSVIMVFGFFLSSVCKHLWSLWLVNGLITGLGMGMCFCSGIVALMTWFDEKMVGLAVGLGAAGSCIGGIVYVLLARHLLATKGYKTTMLVIGAVAAATIVPANLVFRIRGQKSRSQRSAHRPSKTSALTWRTFASPSYLMAAAGMFFSFLGVYFGFVYMISFASTVLKLSNTASTNLLIFMLAANLPGRFLPALISDRCIGPLNTIIPSVFLSSAVMWLWAASGERCGSLTVIACFYGFVSAGIQALYAPTVYSFCLEPAPTDTVKTESTQLAMDRIGIKAGGIFTSIGLACLVGLPIGGALIKHRTDRGLSQPYLGAQIFAGVCLLLGGILLLGSRVAKSGWVAKRT